MFSGITSMTKKNIQLDAGALFKNFVIGTDTPQTATAKLIGATEGGATLAVVPEVRQIPVDGAKGPTKGFEVIDAWTATLSANIKEITPETIKLALGAATITTSTSPAGKKVTPDENFDDGDYLTNVVWVGTLLGSSEPVMIELQNVLSLNGFNLTVADKAEGTIPVVLTAHYDVSNLSDVPVHFYTPTIATT